MPMLIQQLKLLSCMSNLVPRLIMFGRRISLCEDAKLAPKIYGVDGFLRFQNEYGIHRR